MIFKRRQRLQQGTEAVPEELPTPPEPPEAYQSPAVRSLLDQVRQGILPDDALAQIRANPTSLRSMLAYGEAAMAAGTLLSGGEGSGELPKVEMPLPGSERVPFQNLGLRQKEAFARQAGIPQVQKVVSSLSHSKTPDGYDILYNGNKIGQTGEGFTRLGGKGWVNVFSSDEGLKSQTSTHKNLGDALRSAADQIRQREIRKAYEATQTQPDTLPTIPLGETGTGTPEEPPQQYRRGTVSVAKGYGPTHMLNTISPDQSAFGRSTRQASDLVSVNR
jgi:hypothetical protein